MASSMREQGTRMPPDTTPDPEQLPSLLQLTRASAVALVVAVLLGVTTVLPAEAGLDPTGVGTWLGLTPLGELKNPAEAPVLATGSPPPAEDPSPAFRSDQLSLTLKANESTEVKAVMRAGDQLIYTWETDGGELFFDFHGEPKGAAADVFTSFEKGTMALSQGTFEAPFEGVHGWYWKNRTRQPVTVTLKTSGGYQSIARKP
jgi:hypothetical protein